MKGITKNKQIENYKKIKTILRENKSMFSDIMSRMAQIKVLRDRIKSNNKSLAYFTDLED